MRSLYAATPLQARHKGLKRYALLAAAVRESLEVRCVFGQGDPDGVIHHIGNRAVRRRSPKAEGLMDFGREVHRRAFGVIHSPKYSDLAS
jgi:hypothetical protein